MTKRTSPPSDCGPAGSWAGVSLNFTVTSNGTQYDRLGTFTLDDVESMFSTLKYNIYNGRLLCPPVWRTSTPEPIEGEGIIWTYLKDVTRYIPLFGKKGTLILQLDNLLTSRLDGQYASE